jgi:uncharacterized protein (UPF0332 family)
MVLAEWRRARQAIRAAEILTREGCYVDAVARTYYAVSRGQVRPRSP